MKSGKVRSTHNEMMSMKDGYVYIGGYGMSSYICRNTIPIPSSGVSETGWMHILIDQSEMVQPSNRPHTHSYYV